MEKLELILPPEFLEFCARYFVTPETVVKGFIADLCTGNNSTEAWKMGYITSGSDERDLAEQYFNRCCYEFNIEPGLKDLKEKAFEKTVEKLKEELADEEQGLIQEDVENLIEETMIEVYPLAAHNPDLYEIGQEILRRVEATDEYKQIPEDWKDDEK
jgi:hypothetical protein